LRFSTLVRREFVFLVPGSLYREEFRSKKKEVRMIPRSPSLLHSW
jgi:hypothetical protein